MTNAKPTPLNTGGILPSLRKIGIRRRCHGSSRICHVIFLPIGSMYGIFTYIYHKNQLNVSKYAIHGSYGLGCQGIIRKCLFDSIGVLSLSILFGDPLLSALTYPKYPPLQEAKQCDIGWQLLHCCNTSKLIRRKIYPAVNKHSN